MQHFARVESGLVAEVITLPDGANVADHFHPTFAAAFVACPETVRDGYTYNGSAFTAPPAGPTMTVSDLKRYASSVRYDVETGGVAFNMGGGVVVPLPTDRDGRVAFKDARDMLRDGELLDGNGDVLADMAVTVQGNSMRVTAAQATTMLQAIGQHVQASFDLEATVLASIDAGTITTKTSIDTAFGV